MSEIKTVGVVGAGLMGTGIAEVCALAGLRTILIRATGGDPDAAVARVKKSIDGRVAKGKLEAAVAEAALAKLSATTDLARAAECDLVIESIVEDLATKRALFASLAPHLRPDAILASNTSSISITKLAAASGRPDRVVGMHFMNPVPLMKLVEIVRGLPTSDATYKTTVGLAQRFGKTTIGARDIPGFIVNRVLIPLLNEACYALYEGLGSASDIDTGVKLGLNHPMGPLELADLIGLDTVLAIAGVLHHELGDDKYRPCPLLRQHVAAGWLGKKTGRGFYQYDATGNKVAP